MIKFKPGDKVKFLNEKGGGIVRRIIDSRMILVAIEDGFEIPVLVNDLLLADGPQEPEKRNQVAESVRQEMAHQAEEEDTARRGSLRRFAKSPEQEGIYLAFVPHDQQWILTGLMDVVLVNHSPAELLYSMSLQEDRELANADYGQLAPYSKVNIETISRDDINYWCKGIIQALLVIEKSREAYLPLHAPFDIKPSRFYKEGSYVMSGVLGDKALMVNLSSLVALLASETQSQMQKFDLRVDEPTRKIVKETAMIDKHRQSQGVAVVDLHIGELVDNILGMSSKDMFALQINYFHKALESAIKNDYEKVTFIHGVGNGVLKEAIANALKDYEGTENRMASMSKFGVGAIEVIIRDKS
ncbi:MAG: DUF2027 domain-containing protein [Bacteroidetes bacterium]|nr:DUF2027 domain-containing protein [Bacteroidota bacterium]